MPIFFRSLVFLITFVSLSPSFAQESKRKSDEDRLRQRIEQLEKTVETLQDKVAKMESTLMKGGGFMITANYTCEIATPFDGTFTATELSEKAAQNSVIEQCKAKVPDKAQCSSFLVKCNK